MQNELEITEKEYAIIREIHKNHLPDQRTLATRTGISLGMTNLIVKKLIKKGYIKAKQLNQKKIQYLLTPKGFTEKAKKSYHFTLKTIDNLKHIREKVQDIVIAERAKGAQRFMISGNNDLAYLAEIAIKNIDPAIPYERNRTDGDTGITLTSVNGDKTETFNIMELLVESGLFY